MTADTILNDLSFETAWTHLEWLNEHAPARISGTPDQERAAEYFVERLKEYGLDARLHTFTAYRSVPTRGDLEILSPANERHACEPCGHIVSTPDEGLIVDLHYLGPGDDESYAGRDVRGAAVLTEIAAGPSRPEKAWIAARHGASVIIFINWGLPEFDTIPCGAIKCVWGNPTRATMADIPQIAALGISRASGDRLIELLGQSRDPVRARVIAQATRDWGPLTQPWARLRAPNNASGQFLIVGGHHDAWKPGMTDNGAGNALKLELARVFAHHRDALARDIVFTFWNGHEIGDYEGSTWFVDRYWDDIDSHAVAYFNVDSVGFAHTSFFLGDSTPELQRFHQDVERNVLGTQTGHRHLTRDNEHPFFGIGLPALEGRFHFAPEQVEAWGGARGGWWWHSTADTLDKIDHDRYRDTMRVYGRYILEMCTAPVLPMEFGGYAERIRESVTAMQRLVVGRLELDLPIDPLTAAARRFETAATRAREDRDLRRQRRLNEAIIRVSRILLPAFETAGGRYAQDIVGLEALQNAVPALHGLHELARAERDSDEAHLLETELVRERNRLSDALRGAADTLREASEA